MANSVTGRRGRRLTAVGAAALLVGLAGACASEADPGDYADVMTDAGGPASGQARALAQASERSASEAYRVTVSMRMHAEFDGEPELAIDAELASGEVDGDRYEMHMDLDETMAGMGGEGSGMPGADASLDMAGDSEVAYLRASGLGDLADAMGEDAEATWMADLDELGDRWGRIDLSEVDGLSPGAMTGVLGGTGGGSPQDMLAALAATDGAQAEDLGTDEIDGVTVHGTRFTLPFDQLVGDDVAADMSARRASTPTRCHPASRRRSTTWSSPSSTRTCRWRRGWTTTATCGASTTSSTWARSSARSSATSPRRPARRCRR